MVRGWGGARADGEEVNPMVVGGAPRSPLHLSSAGCPTGT